MAQETIGGAAVARDPGANRPAGAPPTARESILPEDLRSILDGLTAGLSVQDDTGRLVYVNDDAARLSGFDSPEAMLAASPAELMSRFELLDETGGPLDFSALPGRRALAGDDPPPLIVGFRLRAGSERWSIVRARALDLADGRRVAVNTFIDITPRIELEQRLRASEQRTQELAEERRRASELARLMADTALRLDEAADTATVVQAAAESAVPVLADWCVVDLIDGDGELQRLGLAARDPELAAAIAPLRDHPAIRRPARASRRAVAEGRPVVVLDPVAWWASQPGADPDLQRILTEAGLRNAIAQPLTARGAVIGSIVLATVGERTFDDAAIAASAELASRLGVAVANSQAHEAEQRARRAAEELASRMERMQAVARTLADAPTVEAVVGIVADETRRTLGAESVLVGLVDETGKRLDLVLTEGTGSAATGRTKPGRSESGPIELDSASPLALAVREERGVWLEGAQAAPAAASDRSGERAAGTTGRTRGDRAARAAAGAPTVDAECAVPLVADQVSIGALWLRFAGRRTFDAADQRLIRAYADLAAGAISRVRLGAVRQLLLAANEAERARLESVLRQMPIGVILANVPDGRFLYANEAARRLSPMPVEVGNTPAYSEARGFRRDGTPLGPDDWPLRRAMAGATVENEVIAIAYPDGLRRTFALSAAPILGPAGEIEAALVTYTDVSDRILAEERERFLARATEVLASSLDYEKTIQAVADLVVPDFADWCVVHVPGDSGVPRRIAVAHRDPALVALATRLQEEYPPDPDATTGSAAILRTGKSEIMTDIPQELLDAAARDDHHRDMIRKLSLKSYISVPLIASGGVIGVLTLVGSEGSHRFAPDDVAFAEALAARAAAAIETARLFREGVRFKRLLDATGDAILMLDPETWRIHEANRGAADQLQRPVDEIVGSTILEHLDPDGAAVLDAAIAELRADPATARTIEIELRRRDETGVPVEVRLETVALDGMPAMLLAISRDIRDRIQVRERLRRLAESEHARAAELNAVIQAMGEGVVVCDREGRILLANPAAEDTFPDVETNYRDILDQLDDPERRAPRLGQRAGPVELRVRGGDERWIEVSTWPVAGGRDRATSEEETIVLLRDVTEQRQRQVVRDTFIGVLSHELRTPVTTIYAGAKVLGRSELDAATRQGIFDDIVVESERLHRLVEDVVAMTRFGDEGGDVGAEPVLLQRLLPPVVTSEQGRWPGVTFTTDIRPGLPTVIADPTYVEQVMRNLLSNAAKYGGPATNVEVEVTAVDREVRVRILDDGPGFPEDEVDRLFELFFRSAATARAAAGAGIGLFVCARLIRAMGGRIWATNREARGAEFGFSLKVMDEE